MQQQHQPRGSQGFKADGRVSKVPFPLKRVVEREREELKGYKCTRDEIIPLERNLWDEERVEGKRIREFINHTTRTL